MTMRAKIDTLMSAQKALVGNVHWVEEENVAKLAAAIAVDGIVEGGLLLHASATLRTTPQRGDAVLVYEQRPIARIAHMPKHIHANPARHPIPSELRFARLAADSTRIFKWEDNRWWPREGDDPLAGRRLEPQLPNLKGAIDRFLELCNIAGDVPEAPWRPELGL